MKLASFEVRTDVGPARRTGLLVEGSLVDLTEGYARVLADDGYDDPVSVAETMTPPDMLELLRRGEQGMEAARSVEAAAGSFGEERGPGDGRLTYEPAEVTLLSPLPRPNSIRDFVAFEEHIANSPRDGMPPDEWYELPVYYKGDPDAVVHPGETISWPSYSEDWDYELEAAAVIGQTGRNVDADEASEYIAGYTVFNDFSARDMQMTEVAVGTGPQKGKDFANGLGPYIVTPDELDLSEAAMTAHVNGEVWSEGGHMGEMYYSFEEMIEHVSADMAVHAGDVFGSGTVGGGCGMNQDKWLESGDEIELEIEGIGTLRHTVV